MTDFLSSIVPPPVHPAVHSADEFDDVTPVATTTLTSKPLPVVPASVVKIAQTYLDGVQHPDGAIVHTGSHTFAAGQEARAKAFAEHMKNAEGHTNPPSRITVSTPSALKVSFRVVPPRKRRSKAAMLEAKG